MKCLEKMIFFLKYVKLKKRFRRKISKLGVMKHLIDHPEKEEQYEECLYLFLKKA